jgi:hypothetical protein
MSPCGAPGPATRPGGPRPGTVQAPRASLRPRAVAPARSSAGARQPAAPALCASVRQPPARPRRASVRVRWPGSGTTVTRGSPGPGPPGTRGPAPPASESGSVSPPAAPAAQLPNRAQFDGPGPALAPRRARISHGPSTVSRPETVHVSPTSHGPACRHHTRHCGPHWLCRRPRRALARVRHPCSRHGSPVRVSPPPRLRVRHSAGPSPCTARRGPRRCTPSPNQSAAGPPRRHHQPRPRGRSDRHGRTVGRRTARARSACHPSAAQRASVRPAASVRRPGLHCSGQ